MNKFRDHKYTWQRPFDQVRHMWQLRGPEGGIHFHVSMWDGPDAAEKHGKFGGPSAGLEFHHNFNPSGGRQAADHSPCWLTGQPCWHDGTSMYASEWLWPRIEVLIPNHATIFRLLEDEYERHFQGYELTQADGEEGVA